MDIHISERIREDPRLFTVVDRASKLLAVEAPPSGQFVKADWDVVAPGGQGRPSEFVEVKVSDRWSGDAATRFTADDLMDQPLVEARLIRLWGDLLQDRSHKQLEELRATAAASEGD